MLDVRMHETRRPVLPFRRADVSAQEFDEPKLLDQLRESIALPGAPVRELR